MVHGVHSRNNLGGTCRVEWQSEMRRKARKRRRAMQRKRRRERSRTEEGRRWPSDDRFRFSFPSDDPLYGTPLAKSVEAIGPWTIISVLSFHPPPRPQPRHSALSCPLPPPIYSTLLIPKLLHERETPRPTRVCNRRGACGSVHACHRMTDERTKRAGP